jgi:hypothetical protein
MPKVLIVSDSFDENTYKSARNVKPVKLATASGCEHGAVARVRENSRYKEGLGKTGGKNANERAHDIIQTASLTEKSSLLSEKQNKYVFRVSPRRTRFRSSRQSRSCFKRRSWT